MAKQPDGFKADLQQLQGEVEADVDQILKIAEQAMGPAGQGTRVVGVQPITRKTRPRTERPKTPSEPNEAAFLPPPPVLNVTTRLTQRTNELLTEAALRQRLSKTTPATRQDIIETALRQWLAEHGYDR